MADFPFVHREVARFSDLDPIGQVNNAVRETADEWRRRLAA